MSFKNADTPCIGVCSTVYGDDVCRGCNRFALEVIEWNTYNSTQKSETLKRLNTLITAISTKYYRVINASLLQDQCQLLNVRYRHEFDPQTWAYMLLKTHAHKMNHPEQYGFNINPEFERFNLPQLLTEIDAEIFAASMQQLQNNSLFE